METPKSPTSIEHRIQEGLARLAVVMRADDWNRARAAGVNPTQQSILEFLQGRAEGAGLTGIAAHLVVSQPTVTDSVAALERKGLIERRIQKGDRRGVNLVLTEAGRALLDEGCSSVGNARIALEQLGEREKGELLVTVIKLIKSLQDLNAIPVQRMCASCHYFLPFAHPDNKPHHCNYVDAAFGQPDLRIDCRDHVTADPPSRAATWNAFERG